MSESILLTPPDQAEVEIVCRGVVGAVTASSGLTELQQLLIESFCLSMTGHAVDVATTAPMSAAAFADAMRRRNEAFKTRVVQLMLLAAFVVRPLEKSVATQLRDYADALDVRDDMVDVAERYADGALELANTDFLRNGYLGSVDPSRLAALHTDHLDTSWGMVSDDPALAAQWQSLEALPIGTMGRGVAEFYRDRGFVYPGLVGSAPPLLAQHDWVHVLANYGTTLENEIEVFAFMARANDDPRAFSLLALVISLFETGYVAAGAGLFEANIGHLDTDGMATRLGDAMRRGALTEGSHDFLDLDFFAIADRPIEVVRAEIGLVPKHSTALAAGSVGPWQAGGITDYQRNAAKLAADVADREYVEWAPDPMRA